MADKPHVHVEFYTEPVEDVAASREAGRPIFKDQEFVRVRIVGDPKNNLIAPANDFAGRDRDTGEAITWAQKYPEHYRLFKAQENQSRADGTPLTEVPWLTASRRKELEALQIKTVEALASLDGALLTRIGMGARELKLKAQAWLDAAAGSAVESKMAAELAARDEEIEALKRQMAQLISGNTVNNVAATEPQEIEQGEGPSNSPFEAWQDEDIKNWIKDATGSRPPGNPSHKTLVAKADEINASLAEKQAA